MCKKLTQEVFTYRPVWAEWAAVDKYNCVYWFSRKPHHGKSCWECPSGRRLLIAGLFDASDWENSLIKRQKEPK